MPDYEQSVFISYAWGTERENIVNEIDGTLQQRGIRIVRDKRALGYRGSIRDFMERIGRGSCVIVVISDKYLRSPNCMFELVEISDNKQFHDRVFPVILTDANIYDPLRRIEYIKYWEGKRKELAKAMKTLDPANLQGIREEMDQYDRIRDKISGITSILKDMNTLTPDMHRDSEFSNLYDAIVERLKESSTDVTTEFDDIAKKAAERKANEDREVEAEADRKAKEEAERLAQQRADEDRLAHEVVSKMATRRQTSGKKSGRDIVEINVTGNSNAVSTHGGKATVSITHAAQDEWKAWREKMENEIKSLRNLPAEDQTMVVQNVEQVVKEAQKGRQADPRRIERLLNTISTMAPDILDVLITTIGNPLSGIGLVIKKVGEKVRVARKA